MSSFSVQKQTILCAIVFSKLWGGDRDTQSPYFSAFTLEDLLPKDYLAAKDNYVGKKAKESLLDTL